MILKPTLKAVVAAITLCLAASPAMTQAQDSSPTEQKPADDLQALQGVWKGSRVGHESDGEGRMIIKGNTVRFEEPQMKQWYAGTLTLPSGKQPKEFHFAITESSAPEVVGKTALAIYKLEGSKLTLVGNPPGTPEAPKSFEGDATSRTLLLQRSAREKDKSLLSLKPTAKKVAIADERTIEERFEEADVALALTQYEKLQSAAFELRLKLEVDPPADVEVDRMSKRASMLSDRARELRAETIRRGGAKSRR